MCGALLYFDVLMYISCGLAILSLIVCLFSSEKQLQAGFTFAFSIIAVVVFWFLWRF